MLRHVFTRMARHSATSFYFSRCIRDCGNRSLICNTVQTYKLYRSLAELTSQAAAGRHVYYNAVIMTEWEPNHSHFVNCRHVLVYVNNKTFRDFVNTSLINYTTGASLLLQLLVQWCWSPVDIAASALQARLRLDLADWKLAATL